MAREDKTAYFMFGRFNPPTIGHGSIFRQLAEDAKAAHADAFVFVSSTQDLDKNPLSVDRKMYYLEKLYGDLGIHFINTTTCELGSISGPCTNPVHAIDRLREIGYDKLSMYVGSDRVEGFQWIPKRNIKSGINHPVQIVNKMPPRTANNFMAGISATKIREAARSNNPDMEIISEGTGLSKKNVITLIREIRNASQPVKSLKRKSQKLSPNKLTTEFRSISLKGKKQNSPKKGGYNTRKSKK